RRYMAEATDDSYAACAHLLASGSNIDPIISGLDKALEGRNLPQTPEVLREPLDRLWRQQTSNSALLRLMLRLNRQDAFKQALTLIQDSTRPMADRLSLIETVGQLGKSACVPIFLRQLQDASDAKIRVAALTALQGFADPIIAERILEQYPKLP